MTDYLKEFLDSPGVLLEEMKRLERRAPVSSRETARETTERGQTERNSFQKPGETADGAEIPNAVRLGETAEELLPAPLPEGTESPSQALPSPEKERQADSLPLLDQLIQLERTALPTEQISVQRWSAGSRELTGAGELVPVSLAGPDSGGGQSAVWEEMSARPGWTPEQETLAVSSWTPGLEAQAGSLRAEADWVERADRAFRRDSRRYDGGFCLF